MALRSDKIAGDTSDGSRDAPGILHSGASGDVLVLSMRRQATLVAYCALYEFEDVIVDLTGADRIDVSSSRSLEFSRRVFKVLRHSSGSRRLAWACSPKPVRTSLRRYELFFPVFTHPHELYALASVPEWRGHCRLAACYIAEMWLHQLPNYLLEMLSEFDHIFLGVQHPVEEVARIAGRPCSYLPLAADVVRFSPYPQRPDRVIDVCNIGRRSPVTHAALMALAAKAKIFYYYDTVAASGLGNKQRTFLVQDAAEHRLLHANLLKRSRYYVANRALINDPKFTRGRQEISGRYYEGAAAGTVMIGEPPLSTEFKTQFDWDGAIMPVPFDSPDIASMLAEFDSSPKHLAAIREDNLRNAALRHDWSHRLRTIYDTLGLSPTEKMLGRQRRLESLVASAPGARLDTAGAAGST